MVDRYGGEDCRKASSGLRWDEVALAMPLLDTLASEVEALTGTSNGVMSGEVLYLNCPFGSGARQPTLPTLSTGSESPPALASTSQRRERSINMSVFQHETLAETIPSCLPTLS